MILYEDNSVEVHYADGSKLLLSPCGSEFLFEKAVSPSVHPMQAAERVRQRTPFAISIYRVPEKILFLDRVPGEKRGRCGSIKWCYSKFLS